MINDLNTNTTNLEFTTSGMDLRPAQIKVRVNVIEGAYFECAKQLFFEGLDHVQKEAYGCRRKRCV